MSQNLAFVCSDFNKGLVGALYQDARREFDSWRRQASLARPRAFVFQEESASFLSQDSKKPSKKSEKKAGPADLSHHSPPFWRGIKVHVPGAGEIPQAVKWLLEGGRCHAVLALAVIVRGETAHFDFLCGFLQKALWGLQKGYSQPLVFSILMTETKQQAEKRIQESRGAKDMKSLIQMIALRRELFSV